MKIVSVVRHAKSDWTTGVPDIQRPLNDRGLRNAPLMGRRLVKRAVAPDLMITSPATRAHTTAGLIAAELGYSQDELEIVDELYGADTVIFLEILSGLSDDVSHVMLFGHNPEITNFVNRTANAAIENIPTCGIVEIEFPIDSWSEIGRSRGTVVIFDYPKSDSSHWP